MYPKADRLIVLAGIPFFNSINVGNYNQDHSSQHQTLHQIINLNQYNNSFSGTQASIACLIFQQST